MLSCVKVWFTAGISVLPYAKVKRFLRRWISLVHRSVVWPVDTSPTHRERWQCKCWKGLAPLVGMRATKQTALQQLSFRFWASKRHKLFWLLTSTKRQIFASFPVHRVCSSVEESSHLICLRQQQLIMKANQDAPGGNLCCKPLPSIDNDSKH